MILKFIICYSKRFNQVLFESHFIIFIYIAEYPIKIKIKIYVQFIIREKHIDKINNRIWCSNYINKTL